MKKKIICILLLSIMIIFSACTGEKDKDLNDGNSNNNSGGSQIGTQHKIGEYINFKENIKYSYEGENSENAGFVTYIDYIDGENKAQIRTIGSGNNTVRILEMKNGELRQTFLRDECYYRENFLDKNEEKVEILLKEPLVKGTEWTLNDGRKRYISNVDIEVNTPSGKYQCMEVITEENDGGKNIQYYALEKGMVKQVADKSGSKVVSTLKSIEDNAKFPTTVKFYYPNIEDYSLTEKSVDMVFSTNDVTKMSFENVFKSFPGDNKEILMGPNGKINSMYLNDDGMVYVDFSKEFVKEMNVGSGFELAILQSIVNALGEYYGSDKVYITIDNEPYSSGHMYMEKGQGFKVDFTNVKK